MEYQLTRNGVPILTAPRARCADLARRFGPEYAVEPATDRQRAVARLVRRSAIRAALQATEYESLKGGF